MQRSRLLAAFAFAALTAGLSAAVDVPQPSRRVVVDNLGRSVTIPSRVRRVLSLQPEITRLVVALGAGDRLVGIDHFLRSNDALFRIVFPALDRLPLVSRADYNVNLETVVRLAPDVIFGAPEDARVVRSLETKTGIPTVALSSLGKFDRLREEIRLLGSILGRDERAAELLRILDDRLGPIRRRTDGLDPSRRPRVYLAFWGVETRTPVAYEPVEAAGGTNVAAGMLASFPGTLIAGVGLEKILAWNPECILVHGNYPPAERRVTTEGIRADPRFRFTRAVRENRVRYTFGFWNWWDPAIVLLETEYLAALFHPELFPDFDLERAGNEILRGVYGREGLFTALADLLDCREWDDAR